MAEIKQIGVGRNTNGVVDGVSYVTINGRTIARRLPCMPKGMFETMSSKKRQAIFKMVMWHVKAHRWTIKQTFGKVRFGSACNMYVKVNYAALFQALSTLADSMVAGVAVTRSQVEQAIATYATTNPEAIIIAAKNGYGEVYLTGAWPSTITLNATTGTQSIVVITEANGNTVTITPGVQEDNHDVTPENPGGGNGDNGGGNGDNGDDEDEDIG